VFEEDIFTSDGGSGAYIKVWPREPKHSQSNFLKKTYFRSVYT